jgi:hypothetical protein
MFCTISSNWVGYCDAITAALSVYGEVGWAGYTLDRVARRATWGEQNGMGVLEQLAIGPHAPSGFRGLFDAAAP